MSRARLAYPHRLYRRKYLPGEPRYEECLLIPGQMFYIERAWRLNKRNIFILIFPGILLYVLSESNMSAL